MPPTSRTLRHLARALDEVPAAVMITDVHGTIEYINTRFSAVTGYSREEALGRTPRILKSGRTPQETYGELWRTIRRGQIWRGELLNRRSNGDTYWDSVSITPLRTGGREITHFLALQVDISNGTGLGERVRQVQKMEAVGRLAGGVAHEFNNLLTIVLTHAELMLLDLPQDDPRREDLERIRRAGQDAATLTGQLLTFGRREVVEPEPLVLGAGVAECAKLLERVLGEDIDLVVTLEDTDTTVVMDRSQLDQIVLNLALNARDAMPGGGRLVIETAAADVDEDSARMHRGGVPGRYVVLRVTDSGHGMDADTRGRIFEPFFTTKRVSGTGLGLATVHRIVAELDGFIRVESEPGVGSSFEVYLPERGAVSEAADPRSAGERGTPGVEVVLLVEDEDDVRAVSRQALERMGYTVLEVRSAEEALEVAHARIGALDLLITDVVMPSMSGVELAERFGALHPGVPVLYVSGYPDEALVRRRMLPAGLAYLQKPFTARDLARKVRAILDEPQA